MRVSLDTAALLLAHIAHATATNVAQAWYLPATTDADLGITARFAQCASSEESQSVAGRRACLAAENAAQDLRLNQAYAAALSRLTTAHRRLLQESQRGWIRMMPAHCQLEAALSGGGTDAPEDDALCQLRSRAYRSKYLESVGR